ncbi:hypothetical protein HanIR_Chr09g0423271 [Helianthus annuus]|nr:hypothetical protein HanIR_Chr09g0423271 [Helianthus annuus]
MLGFLFVCVLNLIGFCYVGGFDMCSLISVLIWRLCFEATPSTAVAVAVEVMFRVSLGMFFKQNQFCFSSKIGLGCDGCWWW